MMHAAKITDFMIACMCKERLQFIPVPVARGVLLARLRTPALYTVVLAWICFHGYRGKNVLNQEK